MILNSFAPKHGAGAEKYADRQPVTYTQPSETVHTKEGPNPNPTTWHKCKK